MKIITIAILFLFLPVSLIFCQNKTTDEEFSKASIQKEFEDYKKQSIEDFNNYRDKVNAEFAEFMRKDWEGFQSFQGIPVPKMPEPIVPQIKDPNEKASNDPIPYEKVISIPPKVTPHPIGPLPTNPEYTQDKKLEFLFYNTPCSVRLYKELEFTLSDVDEEVLSLAWKKLSNETYNGLITDCITLRNKLSLCDWAYISLISKMTEAFFGSSNSNEAVFLQMYLLVQSGYEVRLARANDNKLVLLIASEFEIYQHRYVSIEGEKFYQIASDYEQLHVLNQKFPKEQLMSLQIIKEPNFNSQNTPQKDFVSKAYPYARIKTGANKSLIEFYNNYPRCDWKIYANTPISQELKENIIPALQNSIKGKTKTEAANIIINFVQTAFKYKTDEEQFGSERPFFSDELFYYPYSDCEDRAILFSNLIREILNLDVVLLHYPNHLATAVHFNDETKGDYLIINNKKYIVCDPTYIGAPIGEAMPQFKKVEAEVIELTATPN